MAPVATAPRIVDGAAKSAEFLSTLSAGIGAPITERQQMRAAKDNAELQLHKEVCIETLSAPLLMTYLCTHRPTMAI